MLRKLIIFMAIGFFTLAPLGCRTESPKKATEGSPEKSTENPTYKNTFYITPNYEAIGDYKTDYKNLVELKTKLGTGGRYAKIGFMGVSRYMNETKGPDEDYRFDPKFLKYLLKLSADTKLPIVITFNGGPWGNVIHNPDTDVIEYLEKNKNNVQWKDDGTVPDDEQGPVPGLNRILTYNNLNQEVRKYQKRNLQSAVTVIAEFAKKHPDLFLAITVDPEIFMSPFYYADYNPQTIEEFRNYEKQKFDGSLADFNEAMGTNFTNWNKVDPPRPSQNKGDAAPGNEFWEEWTDFRIYLIDQYAQAEVDWAREAGLPADRIYTHQTVRYDNPNWMRYILASTMKTAQVNGGSLGITTLQELSFDEKLFTDARKASSNWGNFEFNPATEKKQDYKTFIKALRTIYKYKPHIVAPYMWLNPGSEPFYTVKDSQFEKAIRDFLKEVGDKPLQ